MTDPRTLIPIVMGVGLAVITTRDGHKSPGGREPSRHEPLFILATQLVGFAIVGVALFIAAWSAEKGQRLAPGDLKAENLFIVALGAMIAIVAVRTALVDFVHSSTPHPWERGLPERISTFMAMIFAVLLATLLGIGLDEILFRASTMRVGKAVMLVTLLMTAALALTFLLLRFMLKGGGPTLFAMARREQQRMWAALEEAEGIWMTISIKPIAVVRPDYAFTATVWQTARGWFFRADDAYALARYHTWAGNHLAVPVAAFHLHRVSVLAGNMWRIERGMRVTATTRRLWWLDAWRSHRNIPALDAEDGSPERRAGLLLIGTDELRRAGLNVIQTASLGDDR